MDSLGRRHSIARAPDLILRQFLEYTIMFPVFFAVELSKWCVFLIDCNSSPDLHLIQSGFAPMWPDEWQFWNLINTNSSHHWTWWAVPFLAICFSWASGHHIFQSLFKPLLLSSLCLFCGMFLTSSVCSHLIGPQWRSWISWSIGWNWGPTYNPIFLQSHDFWQRGEKCTSERR